MPARPSEGHYAPPRGVWGSTIRMNAFEPNPLEPLAPRWRFASLVTAVIYLTVSAIIVVMIAGCTMPEAARALLGAQFARPSADSSSSPTDFVSGDTTEGESRPARMPGKLRTKMNCAECGVIESIRQIDKRDEITGSCAAGDIAGSSFTGALAEDGRGVSMPSTTLAEIVSGDSGAKRIRMTSRHQLVVRFRDGTRHVFNEETPRSMRVGDHIQVISNAPGPSG